MGEETTNNETKPTSFEEWLKGQSQQVRDWIDGHVTGLKNALQSQKDANASLRAKLQSVSEDSKKDAEGRIAAMQAELAAERQRNTFNEGAAKLGIKNSKLAFIAAKEAGLLHEDGTLKEDKFKEQFPELLGVTEPIKKPVTGAGAGAGEVKPVGDMNWNDAVRASAGRPPIIAPVAAK